MIVAKLGLQQHGPGGSFSMLCRKTTALYANRANRVNGYSVLEDPGDGIRDIKTIEAVISLVLPRSINMNPSGIVLYYTRHQGENVSEIMAGGAGEIDDLFCGKCRLSCR